MPAVPSCPLEPLWDQFAALLPAHDDYAPTRPLGCHRRRVPDRIVFEHIVQALVHGTAYERIASPGCSDRTIRRRVKLWSPMGISERVHALALQAYDRVIGLGLAEISVDGCITRAPSGGEKAGRSPVDRGKQGLKRSVASDAAGVPLGIVAAGANRHDSPLLGPTLEVTKDQVGALSEQVNVNLDRGYDSARTRALLDEFGVTSEIARKGVPAPVQAGKRWVIERSHSWMNGYGKLRRCTEKDGSRGLLPLPRRRFRHAPHTHPMLDEPLSLGRPPHHQAPQVIHLPVGLSPDGKTLASGSDDHHVREIARCLADTPGPHRPSPALTPPYPRSPTPGA